MPVQIKTLWSLAASSRLPSFSPPILPQTSNLGSPHLLPSGGFLLVASRHISTSTSSSPLLSSTCSNLPPSRSGNKQPYSHSHSHRIHQVPLILRSNMSTAIHTYKKFKSTPGNPPFTIGTHDGTFHCDEALACFLLSTLTLNNNNKNNSSSSSSSSNNSSNIAIPLYTPDQVLAQCCGGAVSITRSRDPAVLDTLDVLVDVGSIYDPEKLRFDHHQRGCTQVYSDKYKDLVRLSSAGMVYKNFGSQIIRDRMAAWLSQQEGGGPGAQKALSIDDASVEAVMDRVYDSFIKTIDAIDNGISPFDAPAELVRYDYKATTLSARVGRLNPTWNQEPPLGSTQIDAQFMKAVRLTGSEFLEELDYVIRTWYPARALVQKSLQERHARIVEIVGTAHAAMVKPVPDAPEIVILDRALPWKDHLLDLEKECSISPSIKYVIYPDEKQNYRVQAVPISAESFENRLSLPEAWRGLRDQQLDQVTGIQGCIFVHASGFIGGHTTLQGAVALASLALEL